MTYPLTDPDCPHSVRDQINGGVTQEMALKALCTDFFRWWYNQPGTNTDEGFDDWWGVEGHKHAAIPALTTAQAEREQLEARVKELEEAARDVIAVATDTYKMRNGRTASIEGDDGEKCWIVSFDEFESLRAALQEQRP